MLNKRLKYKGKESGMAYILEGSPLNIKIPLKIWNIQRMANVIEAEKGTVLGIVSGITPENGGGGNTIMPHAFWRQLVYPLILIT